MSEDSVSSTRNIGVIQLRLPYIDSRSLSQAWFSALHLASDEKAPAARRRAKPNGAPANVPKPLAPREGAVAKPVARTAPARSRGYAAGAAAATDGSPRGRARRAALCVSAAAERSYPPVRASFAFGLDGARVHILVRRDGATLHVLALCAARHVELVRRALACADLHLRARGEAVCSSVRALAVEEVCA
ncbi:MAG: hypothetical protein ACLPSH_06820 [Vulcanimicrobiaceae bacterium]